MPYISEESTPLAPPSGAAAGSQRGGTKARLLVEEMALEVGENDGKWWRNDGKMMVSSYFISVELWVVKFPVSIGKNRPKESMSRMFLPAMFLQMLYVIFVMMSRLYRFCFLSIHSPSMPISRLCCSNCTRCSETIDSAPSWDRAVSSGSRSCIFKEYLVVHPRNRKWITKPQLFQWTNMNLAPT